MKFLYFQLLFCMLFSFYAHAEIVKVQVQWQPQSCTQSCAQLLGSQFQKVPGVAEIIMNQGGGFADLRWKPQYPFSFIPIQTAMQNVGLGFRNIRVRVRGTLIFQQQTVALISLGDNTPFYLLGPLVAKQGQMTINDSLQNHQLSSATLAQLVEASKQNRIVVIEGPLYQPWSYSWLWLIIEQMQFVQSEANP